MTQHNASPKEHIASLEQLLHQKRDDIKDIAARHGAYNIRVFGSVARGDAGPDSDIDFLIDAGLTTSSWFPAGLILDLEDLIGPASRGRHGKGAQSRPARPRAA